MQNRALYLVFVGLVLLSVLLVFIVSQAFTDEDVMNQTIPPSKSAPEQRLNTGNVSCPEGYVKVPAHEPFTSKPFCVMQWEAKQGLDGKPVSRPELAPWTDISQEEAIRACSSLGPEYHLMTNEEWMSIARHIEDNPQNWADGVIGSTVSEDGGLKRGNVGIQDSVSYDGADPEYGNARNQKAALLLPSGKRIWDFSGNVREMLATTCSPGSGEGKWSSEDYLDWYESPLDDYERRKAGPSNTTWGDEHGIGSYHSGCQERGGIFIRSASWDREGDGGIYYLNLGSKQGYENSHEGFRCVNGNIPANHSSETSGMKREEQSGIWVSVETIRNLSVSDESCGWYQLERAAQKAEGTDAILSDQESDRNVYLLAASIAYVKTNRSQYREEVEEGLRTLVAEGKPEGRTLAWARETMAYVIAADLIGYRTPEFEEWLHHVAYRWEGSDERTLWEMYRERPNNWGTMAFASLTAIFRYLGEDEYLDLTREVLVRRIEGPHPAGTEYKLPNPWFHDKENPLMINPKGTRKDGIVIDGLFPEEMRRGGRLKEPPEYTNYPWEALEGLVSGGRILERAGMSIWEAGDQAILRAVEALQVRLAEEYANQWKAEGDDAWLLPFVDAAYGTNFTQDYSCGDRVFREGKLAGYGWVSGVDLPR